MYTARIELVFGERGVLVVSFKWRNTVFVIFGISISDVHHPIHGVSCDLVPGRPERANYNIEQHRIYEYRKIENLCILSRLGPLGRQEEAR